MRRAIKVSILLGRPVILMKPVVNSITLFNNYILDIDFKDSELEYDRQMEKI